MTVKCFKFIFILALRTHWLALYVRLFGCYRVLLFGFLAIWHRSLFVFIESECLRVF